MQWREDWKVTEEEAEGRRKRKRDDVDRDGVRVRQGDIAWPSIHPAHGQGQREE